ncbi:META domain-containing protein [Thalassotalea psychrophila]|uniref:META domain-containing protein n=1 Tax=Thalassotalea psychrophila TaxID=3065647 RepID=A0ABY9TT47_9GAMM|nr:META domain-containing protein [Colwelliaceae bacterium SQ149]
MSSLLKKLSLGIVASVLCVACQSNDIEKEQEMVALMLTGQIWNLTTLAGAPAIVGESNKAVSIEFLIESNTYRGYAGCNNYSGRFETADNNLEIGPARATRKFCQNTSEQENKLFNALSSVDNYKIIDKTLTVSDDLNQVLAVFTIK